MMTAIPYFDGHCDTISRCLACGDHLDRNSGHLDLERLGRYAPRAQFFAIFADCASYDTRPLCQVFDEQYAFFQRELALNYEMASFCTSGEGAQQEIRNGRTAAFLSVEGAELLGCDLDRLEEAYRLGVRAVNLTWNHPNALAGTNAEEQERGLSALGREFVKKMQRLGMLVDVSHLSDPGFWDVIEVARKPIFASHSNARGVFFHPRNLTDGQFTAIIENHGVVGLNLYAAFLGENPNLDTVIAHIEHFLALGGAEHISLGGDWDGCDALPQGIAGVQDMGKLYERLLRRNYPEPLVQGLFYDNLMRVVKEVCTM